MSCSSCGGGGAKSVKPQVLITNQSNLPMKEWIESLGWKYIGRCGCAENKNVYLNDAIPEWKIMTTPQGSKLEMWRLFNAIDGKRMFIGGTMNYQDVYNHALLTTIKLTE